MKTYIHFYIKMNFQCKIENKRTNYNDLNELIVTILMNVIQNIILNNIQEVLTVRY